MHEPLKSLKFVQLQCKNIEVYSHPAWYMHIVKVK